ncbi:MAG: MFS transporter, partial [Bacteroidota bacterium]
EEINGVKYLSIDLISFESVPKEKKNDVFAETFTGSVVKEKSFLGYKINDLYSFFMLFVFMAGISSIILFFLSSILLKMMHGIR